MSLGRWQTDVVSAGRFALDGGAMFGIIPRPLWQRRIPADERGRIHLETNVLVLRDGERTVLVDCGMGEKWSDKERDIFAVEPALVASLASLGLSPADVTDLVLTHLHFDHAGGTTVRRDDGELALAFENARVHVGRRNFDWAQAPTERDRGSYRDESWSPLLREPDRLVLHDDQPGEPVQILDDIVAFACEGHTTGQLIPLVGSGDRKALYAADMVPTHAHVRIPWNMAYDLRPIDVMKEKRALLTECSDGGALIVFEHDPEVSVQRVERDGDDFRPVAPSPGDLVEVTL
jgi:glyoxylase-like metal-dependent hydrolase (beta-lactamase superfamily II)